LAHDIRDFGRRVLVAANVLGALAAACFVVVLYVAPGMVGSYDDVARDVRIPVRASTLWDLVFVVALGLLALNLLYFAYGRRPRAPLHFVPSESPGGVVKVSREALEGGLRAAGESLDVVSRLRVNVEHGAPKRVVVRALFQAPEGVSILEAGHELRSALAGRFQEMVQVTDGVKAEFDIEFVGFSGKLARKREDLPKEEPPPFTGPKYPIPEEDSVRGRAHGS
jgi:hypothetical protein